MLRIAAIIGFVLSLLCPVFCLAETADECSAHAQPDGENCEAMSFGAVVETPNSGPASADQLLLSLDCPVSPSSLVLGHHNGLRPGHGRPKRTEPPPSAGRRQALLQIFLF